ncbi:MAG: DNA mismatch repair protein MutS [Deltaproteobacteria bacterium]|nr:DNA mismatch repair protein MutS [Deltaproteobacteria bacterium]MBW2360317.1 DNA mismatch repair protein MutS [Deltaproteobacteria bacterium]
MMRQFLAIKAEHPDAIVFYRMGDFYEMFLGDAELAAPLLDITLTTRDKGKPDPVPMCGVPVHAADVHIEKLAALGHRVAICEQVEDAKAAGGRRLVKRQVVEVVTPGLAADPSGIDARQELALAALKLSDAADGEFGLASLDASTGDFRATRERPASGETLPVALVEELRRIGPRELLIVAQLDAGLRESLAALLPNTALTEVAAETFSPSDAPVHPDGLAPADSDAGSRAAAALLQYLAAHQPFALGQIARLRHYALHETMVLDAATAAHLELFRNSEDGGRARTLLARIDETVTPLGGRRLARWLAYPLLDPDAISERQEAVAYFFERDRPRLHLRRALAPVRDLERILAKTSRPGATPRDLAGLRDSLEALPGVAAALAGDDGGLLSGAAPPLVRAPAAVPEVARLLREALIDEPPALAKGSRGANETGYVRDGYHSELDGLREAMRKGREWIAGLETQERQRTGIPTLKIRFHPVHGYALEVTKSQLSRVPEDYERKQTLANAERFTTGELRETEQRVLGAGERAAALERKLFEEVRVHALDHAGAIGAAADVVAELDTLAALAEVARNGAWVRPIVDAGLRLEICAGRHPVVEPMLTGTGEEFVPNDARLDPDATAIVVLTGPNMSGKSTYLRQVALLVLLAQIGSYVPAESASIGVVDRVFTRVGASDRLARGESTFMVEMRETAEILAFASQRSLVILDEIGRGTSTFDGLSIAWAVAEYLHDTPGLRPRTLFATHYHELTDLARTKPHVGNGHFEAREWGDQVIFLRRLAPGGASRSYGIQVGRLAGLPPAVVERAGEILANLEGEELDASGRPRLAACGEGPRAEAGDQLGLFAPPNAAAEEVAEALRTVDPERTTPLEALELVARLAARLREDA